MTETAMTEAAMTEAGAPKALDALAIGAHPDDVELAVGGTIAMLVAAGYRVGIVHLTRGEAGTRGTVEERRHEARASADVLGAASLDILDCGDGGLRTGRGEEDALIAVLRKRRPRLVLGPPSADRHPDHGRAHRLVRDACFYSGLARRGTGTAHRPQLVLSYMQHHEFAPTMVVDVSDHWRTKLEALACYRSQLHNSSDQGFGAETKISSPEFKAAVTGRAQHFGQMIGVALGEPLLQSSPMAVRDPMKILPIGFA